MTDRDAARAALREFLITRRARITPAEAGLAVYGKTRRVKGLRREEIALLAGISAEYYIRLERGRATGVSASVFDAVAQALQLTDDEREHLAHLLQTTTPWEDKKPRHPGGTVRPGIQQLLNALTDLPAFVFNGRLDIIATNDLGRALYAPMFEDPIRPANTARFNFLAEAKARQFWPDWDKIANDVVALLRAEAGRHPDDPALIDLVGHLSTRSDEFRVRWAAHNVRRHTSGVKTLRHPLIGELTMPFENLNVAADPDQFLMTYTPHHGSPAYDAISLLASWNADSPSRGTDGIQPRREITLDNAGNLGDTRDQPGS